MNAVQIARVCHEVNRAFCQSIGDYSQPRWDDAPQWQKSSAIDGVNSYIDEAKTPAQMHQSWYDQKVADGWVYGEVKDANAKTHPCMVPYDELPEQQRTKDHLFIAVVETLSSMGGA